MASLIFKSCFLVLSLTLMICLSFSNTIPGDFSTLSNDLERFTSNEDIFVLFKAWQKEHHKEYETKEEELERFEIFKSNLNIVNGRNSKRSSISSYRLGLNKFADLTFEEFSKTHLGAAKIDESLLEEERMSTINNKTGQFEFNACPSAPSFLDWRVLGVVTSVKNQGSCGSCWAFTAAGAIEATTAMTTGQLIDLSPQQLVSCDAKSFGCTGGFIHTAFEYVAQNGGIAPEVVYPYTGTDSACNTALASITAGRINGFQWVLPQRSDASLFCAVARQPVGVLVQASAEFMLYQSGIMDESTCMNIVPCGTYNHGVLIVGYGSIFGQDYWIVKNTWGSNWGVNGYVFIKRNTGKDYGVCNINCFPVVPTVNSAATKLHSAM